MENQFIINNLSTDEIYNILFLDFDGVLVTEYDIIRRYKNSLKKRDNFGMLFCPNTIKFLENILNLDDFKIVISSTWRASGLDVMLEMWKKRKLPGEIIGITKYSPDRFRGKEIKAWIELFKQKYKLGKYFIIDDDIDFLKEQKNVFINTNQYYGLSDFDIEQIKTKIDFQNTK